MFHEERRERRGDVGEGGGEVVAWGSEEERGGGFKKTVLLTCGFGMLVNKLKICVDMQ